MNKSANKTASTKLLPTHHTQGSVNGASTFDEQKRNRIKLDAWAGALCDPVFWLTFLLSFGSTCFALGRFFVHDRFHKDGNDHDQYLEKLLFWFEISLLFISYGIQFFNNVHTITRIRELHKYIAMNEGNPDGWYKAPEPGYEHNGLARGVALPSVSALGLSVIGTVVTGVTFFTGNKTASEVTGVLIPMISGTFFAVAKTRLDAEKVVLDNIVDSRREIKREPRKLCEGDGDMLRAIVCCGNAK